MNNQLCYISVMAMAIPAMMKINVADKTIQFVK